jgi:nucleotide-binding universal stress UspA family protein
MHTCSETYLRNRINWGCLMYKKIVAGTDFSDTAKIATDRSAWLANRLGAELILVHAGSDRDEELHELGQSYGAQVVRTGGNPAEVLVNTAEESDADLLVTGSVGMSGAKRFMLGNVPNKVSHHADTDLLIVKTDAPTSASGGYQRIIVGTDGSATATRAVEMAASLAATLGVKPTIVCVYEPPTEDELKRLRSDPNDPLDQWRSSKVSRETPEEFKWRIAGASQAEDILERSASHAAQMGAEAEVRAVEGSPAETLIRLAEDEGFDLMVVGHVGMRGSKRFKLGNVPHRISHHAPTDVLILQTT